MADPTASRWQAQARHSLEEAGHRSGGARAAVVELLDGEACCLSAQEIFDQLRRRGRDVGMASVYRALELLLAMDLVHRVEVGDGVARYERVIPDGEHHHHVVCERCGAVTAFEDKRLEEAIERLARRLRHKVHGHDVVIRGACPRCTPQ